MSIDFMLSAKRDRRAAKRFLCKALKATSSQPPHVINMDKNAAYPPSVEEWKAEETLAQAGELRQNKY
nr:DDE-type integrase/transposase/recombinase [Crinalium epipsammum]